MQGNLISYHWDKQEFEGFLVNDETIRAAKPGILIAHAWRGCNDFAREKALALAQLGYVAFAADVYGKGIIAQSNEEAMELMRPLFLNRNELRARIQAALEILRNAEGVDKNRLGAIGFCFGGLTVLELLCSGADVRGVVSFHGIYGNELEGVKAKQGSIQKIKGSILLLHGYEDPLVSELDIRNLQRELSDAAVDWQMHTYSQTAHAFTNPQVNDKEAGLYFQPRSSMRAWKAMENYFKEIMGQS